MVKVYCEILLKNNLFFLDHVLRKHVELLSVPLVFLLERSR